MWALVTDITSTWNVGLTRRIYGNAGNWIYGDWEGGGRIYIIDWIQLHGDAPIKYRPDMAQTVR